VSVIAMTLDQERFIAQGLEAIAAQTYDDMEIIVTDDGSTDDSPAILDAWLDGTDRRTSLIRHEQRRGICVTLNEALDRASGELVAIVSLDDVWFPDRLARHVSQFEQTDQRTAVLYSDCEVIDDAGHVTSSSYMARYTPYLKPENGSAPTGDVFAEMVRGNFIGTPGVTIRRSAIDAMGGYDEEDPFEDWNMWLQLAPNFDFEFDDRIVSQYRIHDDGYWNRLQRDPAILRHIFRSLAKAHGRRSDVDPAIVRRLRSLVDEMIVEADPGVTASVDLLAELDAPKLIPITDPVAKTVDLVGSLVGDGHSVASVENTTITVVSEPTGVLYLAPWMTIGGADKGTLDWFRHIGPYSFRRYLLTTLASNNALFDQCDALADEAWCLPDVINRQAIPQFVIDFIATRNIGVLHIMNSKLGFDMIPTIRTAYPNIPVVVQLHCEENNRTGYPRYVASRYDNLISAYSVISDDMKRCMLDYHVSPSKIEVIYLGVDALDEFNPYKEQPTYGRSKKPLDSSCFNVLFPARLTEQKRPDLMLEIAASISTRSNNVRLHVVGDGELRRGLERRRDQMGLREVVLFHGASHDMWRWYSACDAVLLCSAFEGIPLVLFEAMSMGVPAVSPSVGAVGEVLDPGSGITLPSDASATDYADALLELANNDERRIQMGGHARQRVLDRYQVASMGQRHRELYGRLIAQAAVRA
jgi:glycosyltransferase involved in cell wall biosynthesis